MATFTRRQMGEDILPSHINELQEELEWNSIAHTIITSAISNLQAAVGTMGGDWSSGAKLSNIVTTTNDTGVIATDLNLTVGTNEMWEITYYLYGGSAGTDGVTFGLDVPSGTSVIATLSASDGAASGSTWTDGARVLGGSLFVGAWMKETSVGAGILRAVVSTSSTSGTVGLRLAAVTSGQQAALWTQTVMTAQRRA